MTKRFELKMEENKWYFYDNVEEDYIYSKHSVCRLLNTLHQENNYLSIIRKNQQQMILKLKEENEQLKEENKRLKRNVKTFKEDRDSNFESAQYFREQLMKIPESIRSVWIE